MENIQNMPIAIDIKDIWEKNSAHEKILLEIVNKPGSDSPLAVFIGGGAAAGKSTIREKIIIPWLGISPVVIDADMIKTKIDPTQFQNEDLEKRGIQIHKESKVITHQAIYLCLEKKISFVYDSSLAAPQEEYFQFIHLAKKIGFRLIIVGVYTPENIALEREKKRYKTINRKVPERIFRYFHKNFPITFLAIEKEFDVMRLYDNSLIAPSLIVERERSEVHVLNHEKYEEFMQKTIHDQS